MKQQSFSPTYPKPNLETLMEQFVNQQMTVNKQNEEQLKQLNSKLEHLATRNRIFETQIAQQASSSNTKPLGNLPSQPEFVYKETCKAITLRSCKEVEADLSKKKRVVDDNEVENKEVGVNGEDDDEGATKGKEGDDIPSKELSQGNHYNNTVCRSY